MQWTMSDGTIVRLGGEVEGASLFALQLRTLIEDGRTAISWPGRDYVVDLSDATPGCVSAPCTRA
jgi:hypothetical protein